MIEFSAQKYAVELIYCVLNNKTPALPDEFNWAELKMFCEKNCITNLVAYAFSNIKDRLPEEIKLYFEEIIYQSLAKEARLEIEVNLITELLEKNNIKNMPLKGIVIKNYYPQPDMRSMGDVDILVGDKLSEAESVMTSLGYTLKSSENLHDSYFKKPFINIELHSSLVDKELTELYNYFGVGFEKAMPVKLNSFKYNLSDEDFYIFLLAHLAKHFKSKGTGIRSIIDIYVYLCSHQKLNFDYIYSELNKIGLLKFAQNIETISKKWFAHNDVDIDNAVENYILSSGVYGSIYNLELNRFLQNKNQSKLKYFINVVFPNISYMSARYPIITKHKYLLPLYWIIRIFDTAFKSFGSIKYRLNGVLKSNKKSKDKFNDFS